MLTALLRQIALLHTLIDIMDLELRSLQRNDASGIEAAAEKKFETTQALAEIDQRRQELLVHAAFSSDASGLEQLIRQCEPGMQQRLRRAWTELLALSQRCHEENARNGQVNAVAQRLVREMLAHLRGKSMNSDIYDRDGRIAVSEQKALGRV